jgi:hypothetical protein
VRLNRPNRWSLHGGKGVGVFGREIWNRIHRVMEMRSVRNVVRVNERVNILDPFYSSAAPTIVRALD